MSHSKAISAAVLTLFLACCAGIAQSKDGDKPKPLPPINRFVWQTHRIRTVGAIDGKATISRRTVLVKCDTVTGKVWRYRVVEEDAGEPEEGEEPKTFISIPIEDLEVGDAGGNDDKDDKPERPQIGRFGLVTVGVPSVIKSDDGREGLGEKTELMLVDTRRGRNWVYDPEVVWQEGKATVNERFRHLKGEDDEIIEEVAVKTPPKKEEKKSEPKREPPKQEAFKPAMLKKSDDDWRAFFMAHHVGNEFQSSSKSKVACVIVLDKSAQAMTPWVVFRKGLENQDQFVSATPWEVKLYSDAAVDHLCDRQSVPLADAGRLAIYISDRGTAKGFKAFPAVLLTEIPDRDKASNPIRTE